MSGSENSAAKQSRPALTKQELQRLLAVRSRIKSRTPYFKRFESWRYARIDEPWRKPKGVDNHMRLSVKGWPHLVKIGYRVPKQVRYLHPSGYKDVLVHNMVELEALSPDTDAARLAANLGKRKKIELAKRAEELGLKVLNGRGLLSAKNREEEEEAEDSSKSKDDAKKASQKKSK